MESKLETGPIIEDLPEQVRLTAGLIVSTDGINGAYKIVRPGPLDLRWSAASCLPESSTPLKTQALLDGAYMAAYNLKHTAAPCVPKTTYAQNVWNLINFYHPMLTTPKAQKIAALKFEEMGRPDLAEYAYRELEEETGHHTLVLEDLQAMGLPAVELITAIKPPSLQVTEHMMNYANHFPLRLFGYNYAMERIASLIGQAFIDVVKKANPPGIYATRTLEVHSSVGSDARHVQEMTEFVAGLAPADREEIVLGVFESASMSLAIPGRVKTDEEIDAILRAHGFDLEELRRPVLASSRA